MQKNVASQKWIVFAFDRTDNTAKTGDAANITANLRLDGGGANAVDDTNPTELEDGYYVFDITQAETNADMILITPVSSTANIQVIGVPGAVYTTPAAFPTLTKGAIVDEFETQSQADPTGFHVNIKEVNGTPQTANDNGADINDILTDTGTTLDALIKDVPTVSEFEARSIVAANYVVVGDTIAGVTAITNDVGITQAGADKVWGTAARALTDKTGFALSAAGITAIWEKNISAFSGAGYAGTYVKTLYDDWINAGRLDAILDIIAADVVNIDGDAMRGTDSANTTTPPTVNAIADQVWDEILTGATHNIATSAGRRLREIAGFAIHSGTARASTITTITLAADADGGDGIFNRNLIVIIGGTGAGQTRTITDYDDTTKVCAVDREWHINPDATSEYQILADDTPLTVDHGIARGGTLTTLTLRASASSVNNIYLCNIIAILGGTGRGQARLVGNYNGTTKVVTVCGDDWVDTPDTTSIYAMIPYGTTCTSCVGSYALTQIADAIAGSGALSCTWTQKDDGDNPMDNVQVWISTDEAGNNVVAGTLITDASGEVTFMLDAGTYYVWRERASYNFTNPQTWTVS